MESPVAQWLEHLDHGGSSESHLELGFFPMFHLIQMEVTFPCRACLALHARFVLSSPEKHEKIISPKYQLCFETDVKKSSKFCEE